MFVMPVPSVVPWKPSSVVISGGVGLGVATQPAANAQLHTLRVASNSSCPGQDIRVGLNPSHM